jgi:hypothetical protein
MATQMPTTSAEIELRKFLKAVEDGSVSLIPEQEPQDVYAGNVSYLGSNGWRILVFNDANEWDYIDSITTRATRSFFTITAWSSWTTSLRRMTGAR